MMNYLSAIDAGYNVGTNLGALRALAERVETDFHSHGMAAQVLELHNRILAGVIERAKQSPVSDVVFKASYFAAFKTFNRPITADLANDIFRTATDNLQAALAV
jgi:hypothetical protein